MGKGDFLLDRAKKAPGHYLGLERDLSVLGVAAKKILAEDIHTNIRLRGEDFDFLFEEELQGLSFDAIYLNFSDPWPKRRHWKRRLTTRERLLKMNSLLKDGGKIVFKSDNRDLYQFTLEEAKEAGFPILFFTEAYPGGEDDVMSEYEKNFRSQNKPITRVILGKKGE
jgi:tRNA (guanine-N7-)-methyltransferase